MVVPVLVSLLSVRGKPDSGADTRPVSRDNHGPDPPITGRIPRSQAGSPDPWSGPMIAGTGAPAFAAAVVGTGRSARRRGARAPWHRRPEGPRVAPRGRTPPHGLGISQSAPHRSEAPCDLITGAAAAAATAGERPGRPGRPYAQAVLSAAAAAAAPPDR